MTRASRYLLATLALATTVFFVSAQREETESLRVALKNQAADTNKVKTLNELAAACFAAAPDSANYYAAQALVLAQQLGYKKGMAKSYDNLARYCWMTGDYNMALDHLFKKLKAYEELKHTKFIAYTLGNIGTVYYEQSMYPQALEYYFKALKAGEEQGLKQLQANTLSNLGIVYEEQNDYEKAQHYYSRSLRLKEELGDKKGIAITHINIGNAFAAQGEHQRALGYFERALKIAGDLGDQSLTGSALSNMGIAYDELSRDPANAGEAAVLQKQAIDHYLRALKIRTGLEDRSGIATTLGNLGYLYFKTGRHKEAETHLLKASALSDSLGDLNRHMDHERHLSELYDAMGRHQLAFAHYRNFIATRDSLNSEENLRKQTRIEMNFEFEKKQAVAKAEHDKQLLQKEAERKQQELYMLLVVALAVAAGVVAFIVWRALRVTRKQKRIIEIQKEEAEAARHIIEEKNRDILDSIHYARRIQTSLLPTEKYISKKLREMKKA